MENILWYLLNKKSFECVFEYASWKFIEAKVWRQLSQQYWKSLGLYYWIVWEFVQTVTKCDELAWMWVNISKKTLASRMIDCCSLFAAQKLEIRIFNSFDILVRLFIGMQLSFNYCEYTNFYSLNIQRQDFCFI